MADRLLVFSNPEVQKLLKEQFIPVAGNDWYQRRRQDAEGEFFRKMADQGPRKGEGGSTRQGHYVFTAGGKLLGYNNNRGPERRLQMMRDALIKWEALPDNEKKSEIPKRGKEDATFIRELPSGGRVIKVYVRALEKRDGKLMAMNGDEVGRLAAIDHLWLKSSEEAKLFQQVKADGGNMPDWFIARVLRFHLVDSTRGEPPMWSNSEIKSRKITSDAKGRIKGKYAMQTADGKRAYTGSINGVMTFSDDGKIIDFELLALGLHKGEGKYTKGARPGETALGVYFQINDAKKPADTIPPQGMSSESNYWNSEK